MLAGARQEFEQTRASVLNLPTGLLSDEAFYDLLIERWRGGERSKALWDAIARIPKRFDFVAPVRVIPVGESLVEEDSEGNVHDVVPESMNVCREHRYAGDPCPQCRKEKHGERNSTSRIHG